MTTWTVLRADIRTAIRDEDVPYVVSDASLLRFANYALGWVASRHPKLLFTAGVAITSQLITLPADCIRPVSFYVGGIQFASSDLIQNGPVPARNEWVRLQSDTVRVYGTATTADLAYEANYPALTADGDTIPLSTRLEEAMFNYVVSSGLAVRAVGSGNLDQFDTRIDSGNPEHNPLLQLARHYRKMALEILVSYAQE